MSAAATDQQIAATDEQSEETTLQDQAGNDDAGVDEGKANEGGSDDSSDSEDSDAIELIGEESFAKLKGNPAALAKALNRAATKKFQDLSEQRKALEAYTPFIEALEENPREAVAALAQQLGIEIGGTRGDTARQAASISDAIAQTVKEALGPDYEDLAEKLAPVMKHVAEMVAAETAKPLVEQQDQLARDAAARETASSLEVFGKSHPDWKKHEQAMFELSKKLNPVGMTQIEYLENLYYLATREKSKAAGVKAVVEQINKSAVRGSETTRTTAGKVASRPQGLPTFQQAAAAALRGERFED